MTATTARGGAAVHQVSVVGGHALGLLGLCGALAGTHQLSRPTATHGLLHEQVIADLSCAGCSPSVEELAALAERHQLLLLVGAMTVGLAEEALSRGAVGAVGAWEPVSELRRTVRAMTAGEPSTTLAVRTASARVREVRALLSPQEQEVLRLYGADLPVKTVARRMGITVGTAKEYLKRLRAKLVARDIPVSTKVDLRDLAEELGLLSPARRCGTTGPDPLV
ncbi:RNA polymerase sigma factor, sigma-70 family [Quadrisphaera granulorum]|uniref:RNA polymerase sigma factor (Sigma-70 family) n=1 Tax=Quadrisphaera granulorum TaxID=317664 RepID=A0A316AY58_9ACTN|nr:sigma factor-like helix-turn-helix DNA-binding protein [Quadrisphaera granulorum]PWJ55147.1 RNA polymerase sigma factor (sigma-70 family) [Quadrisphaera granulorum]SZE95656.1 RNA polymerase sigma factor, sigma-70 family [Quadrisphaera granulorum]